MSFYSRANTCHFKQANRKEPFLVMQNEIAKYIWYKMQVHVYTDRNLTNHLLNGWSEEKLIQGKIKTLTGRTITVSVHYAKLHRI